MRPDLQPTLEGPTLRLRPLTPQDHDRLFHAASDPLIWEQHPANRHERAEFDHFFAESLASGGALVIETRTGEVIGTSRYHDLDQATSSVEIGWTFLVRAHWGGTANREAKSLMIDHAFTAVDRVRFLVAPGNLRSQRAVERLGARRLAEPASNGSVAFELSRADWRGQQAAR